MNAKDIQRQQMAGKTKLTLVTVGVSGLRTRAFFVQLRHDERGKAICPFNLLGAIPRGVTFTLG
jgi:hypothetical protein